MPSSKEKHKQSSVETRELHQLDELREAASRLYRIPVFLSHPSVGSLNETQLGFLLRLIREIRKELLFPRTLPRTEAYPESILTNVRRMILSSYGLVAANLRLLEVQTVDTNGAASVPSPSTFWLGSAFAQIEPAMAYQRGLPMLLIIEKGIRPEGVYSFGIAPFTILTWDSSKPLDDFFNSVQWREILQNWSSEVRNGYYIQTNPEFEYLCDHEE